MLCWVLHVVVCITCGVVDYHVVLCTGTAYCVLQAVFMQCFSTEGRGPQGLRRELLWGPLVPQLPPLSPPRPPRQISLNPLTTLLSSLIAPVFLITSDIRLYSIHLRNISRLRLQGTGWREGGEKGWEGRRREGKGRWTRQREVRYERQRERMGGRRWVFLPVHYTCLLYTSPPTFWGR